MSLKLITYPSPSLRTVCKSVTLFDSHLHSIAADMARLMVKHQGVGLAAPQVGLDINMFIAVINDEIMSFVNPQLEPDEESGHQDTEEGCLSIPGILAKLKCRWDIVDIEAQDLKGDPVRMTMMGDEATIIQHEYDHLQGITIFDRMGNTQRTLQKAKYTKLRKRHARNTKRKR